MLEPEPGQVSRRFQEALQDLPAFQSALLGAPKAGMCGPSLPEHFQALSLISSDAPAGLPRSAHTPGGRELRPSVPLPHRLWIFSSRLSAQKALTS